MFPYGVLKLENKEGQNFKVNGQKVKHYFRSTNEVKVYVMLIYMVHEVSSILELYRNIKLDVL